MPAGRHELRFEFEVTGPPDIANGRGAPGRAQLYVDGEIVGAAEVPVTSPLSLGLTSPLVNLFPRSIYDSEPTSSISRVVVVSRYSTSGM